MSDEEDKIDGEDGSKATEKQRQQSEILNENYDYCNNRIHDIEGGKNVIWKLQSDKPWPDPPGEKQDKPAGGENQSG